MHIRVYISNEENDFAVHEIVERIAFLGIQANLVLFLTRELHQDTVASSTNVTNWAGTLLMIQLLGAYIADAYLGRFWTFLVSAFIYLLVNYSNRILLSFILLFF